MSEPKQPTAEPPSRPAPTRDRLLDAAERLFGEHGFAATSLRTVTVAAEANVAAVNYHFGSKEGLLRAVVERAMAEVNGERLRLLEELGAAGDGRPGVAELVRAFVMTGARLVERSGERGASVARFLGRVMAEPDPAIRRLFATEVGPVEGRYLDALGAALPQLSAAEVAFRFRAMVGLLGLHQSSALGDLHPGDAAEGAAPGDDDAGRLVTFLTAAFHAPPTTGDER
ncbi:MULTISPECIES: TetR/AcrR family transcriptional regulator [Streptomyces]|uniref:TetR/AcrR family transcriptional regulator n=1 Tax=Streptomyces lonegramiae TaxID=3075524 RepID=A0ABU2XW04_9ACTN|nr:TetR/AcrR family transcriptional regulator [Streptomyces sp. DSM 41529]MDT0549235.1 TetR/AcrR family transcriptional regulator [Streptomyces sp. DSM 41529]